LRQALYRSGPSRASRGSAEQLQRPSVPLPAEETVDGTGEQRFAGEGLEQRQAGLELGRVGRTEDPFNAAPSGPGKDRFNRRAEARSEQRMIELGARLGGRGDGEI
jgi:hypothetical protein